jgi:hypothetical protein
VDKVPAAFVTELVVVGAESLERESGCSDSTRRHMRRARTESTAQPQREGESCERARVVVRGEALNAFWGASNANAGRERFDRRSSRALVVSRPQQRLDRAAFVHRSVAVGDLVEGQGEVEDLAGLDRAVPDEVDGCGPQPAGSV